MKQLYLKQKVFSFGEKYNVFDENQNIVYHIKGKVFSLRNKMDMYKNDQHIYSMERKLFHLLPLYILLDSDGNEVARIQKNFTLFGGKMTIHSSYGEMQLIGQVFQLDFSLLSDGKEVMSIHKKWISWGDSYEISITDDAHESFYVALVILIDAMYHQSSSHHSSSSSHH